MAHNIADGRGSHLLWCLDVHEAERGLNRLLNPGVTSFKLGLVAMCPDLTHFSDITLSKSRRSLLWLSRRSATLTDLLSGWTHDPTYWFWKQPGKLWSKLELGNVI
jgi:hypothetical protein